MGNATTKELSQVKKVFKSVEMKNAECSVPPADSDTLAKASGNVIIQQALTQAEDIRKKASDEVGTASEKGRKEGFTQGQSEAKKRYDALLGGLTNALESMEKMQCEMSENLSENIIALAMEIAAKILKTEIETDPSVLKHLASEILESIAPAHEAIIRLNPFDFEVLKDFRPQLESAAGYPDKFRMTHDSDLGRGDVIVQYERGTIDARITTQLENIARTLMKSSSEE